MLAKDRPDVAHQMNSWKRPKATKSINRDSGDGNRGKKFHHRWYTWKHRHLPNSTGYRGQQVVSLNLFLFISWIINSWGDKYTIILLILFQKFAFESRWKKFTLTHKTTWINFLLLHLIQLDIDPTGKSFGGVCTL